MDAEDIGLGAIVGIMICLIILGLVTCFVIRAGESESKAASEELTRISMEVQIESLQVALEAENG